MVPSPPNPHTVIHDIDGLGFQHVIVVLRMVVDGFVGAQAPNKVKVRARASGDHSTSSHRLGELNPEMSSSSTATQHQHGNVRLLEVIPLGSPGQRIEAREGDHRHGPSLDHAHRLRLHTQDGFSHNCILRIGATRLHHLRVRGGFSPYLIANLDPVAVRANCHHDASKINPQLMRVLPQPPGQLHNLVIHRVDVGRLHCHEHLAPTGHRNLPVHDAHIPHVKLEVRTPSEHRGCLHLCRRASHTHRSENRNTRPQSHHEETEQYESS
mmetsp:Transcript_15711/g.42834  ORF Transcript_15711/g.42834 Transcript_15711/m.42834 type:complete len:268 (-) Transcript_15711:34-837(-)